MNKKILTLILVVLVSFSFLSIVVADNLVHNDNNTTHHNKTIHNNTKIQNNTTDKNKTDDKPKRYVVAKGKGNNIKFSDGYRGFILDYSKSPAKSGDIFQQVSTSKVSDANTLKLAIIECYKLDSTNQIEDIMEDFVTTGSSDTPVGKAVAASHQMVSNHEVVKINNHTEAVFDFEALKSVSGNESDYFAYTVSFRAITEDKNDTNQTNNLTNETNTTNITNITHSTDNKTNATLPTNSNNDYWDLLYNALYNSWKPLIGTLISDFLIFVNAMEQLAYMFNALILEIQYFIDSLLRLLVMLGSIWPVLEGLLKLIESILNFIIGLISAIIAFIQQLLAWLISFIQFLIDLINQLLAFIQGLIDFLKSAYNYLMKAFQGALIIIIAFVIFTVGVFIYKRIR